MQAGMTRMMLANDVIIFIFIDVGRRLGNRPVIDLRCIINDCTLSRLQLANVSNVRNFYFEFKKKCYRSPHCLKITQNVAFEFLKVWHFPPIFVILKLTCLVTLFDRKLQVFKNSPKWTIFGILINLYPLKM